jgi:hypothetical protein
MLSHRTCNRRNMWEHLLLSLGVRDVLFKDEMRWGERKGRAKNEEGTGAPLPTAAETNLPRRSIGQRRRSPPVRSRNHELHFSPTFIAHTSLQHHFFLRTKFPWFNLSARAWLECNGAPCATSAVRPSRSSQTDERREATKIERHRIRCRRYIM